MGNGGAADLWGAARRLVRAPGYGIAATLTMAMAIGAAVLIFTVVNGVLLQPVPLPDAGELVVLWAEQQDGTETRPLSAPDFEAIDEQIDLLDHVAGRWVETASLLSGEEPEAITLSSVSEQYFEVLGLEPMVGGLPDPHDPNQVLMAEGLWVRSFGRDPGILGRSIRLGSETYTVVGILAADPDPDVPTVGGIVEEVDLWRPMPLAWLDLDWNISFLRVVGRLAEGATVAQLNDAFGPFAAALDPVAGRAAGEVQFRAFGMLDEVVAGVRPTLVVLMIAAILLLATACVNVAQLTSARARARAPAWQIRAALGASRRRLTWMALMEALMIAAAGGLGGMGLAALGLRILRSQPHVGLPRLGSVSIDLPVLAFAIAVTSSSTLVFGLIPALRASRLAGRGGLMRAGSRITTRRGDRALVVSEVAAATVLLVGTGLLLLTYDSVSTVDPGWTAENLTTLSITPQRGEDDPDDRPVFMAELDETLQRLPGVSAAGMTNRMPLMGGVYDGAWATRSTFDGAGPDRAADMRFVTPRFFDAMGIRVLQGRTFQTTDDRGTLVIDAHMAREAFGDTDPVGQEVWTGEFGLSAWGTVIGVVEHARHGSVLDDALPTIYLQGIARGSGMSSWFAAIRSSASTGELLDALKADLARIDPGATISDVRTMTDRVEEALTVYRMATLLMTGFAVASVMLAVIGLYGFLAIRVEQQRRALAVRQALGATGGRLLRIVLTEGAQVGLVGVGIGIGLALLSGRWLRALLYGVSPNDPLVFGTAAAVVAAVVTVASILPALSVIRSDPLAALRAD